DRDRVRSLQLMQQALSLTKSDGDKSAVAQFHFDFAHAWLYGQGFHETWRLQTLTDLTQLQDYEEGYWYRGGGRNQGAAVDAEGNPVFHRVPVSYDAAVTDGERWRWMLSQAAIIDPSRINDAEITFANFLHAQFGVQTMAQFGRQFGIVEDSSEDDDVKKDESGPFAVHTLKEDETIAKLATGIKRFKLPDEFNPIRLFQRIAARGKSGQGEQSLDALARTFEDRRQFVAAVDYWKRGLATYGDGRGRTRTQRIQQIEGNWGRFENVQVQPAGTGAAV